MNIASSNGTTELVYFEKIKKFNFDDYKQHNLNDLIGNTWGRCDDGTYGEGCGPQEIFRNCADVAIQNS